MLISERKKVVVQKSRFRGVDTLDIRTWIETPEYKGFTRKGVNIPIEKGEELAKKILKVVKE
ncbi:MAG: PC4/YdbC family ssDNA-binding protein [Candidatus Hodarchaeaceae archaeon]|nr:PC4/YdbC family ssDNA-binding protein [Candidatus Hodarchaeaceae archaeon]MDI6883798.1 PC4/YdbC family ssDNA-binding protein [Hadesarchaea archaeon]